VHNLARFEARREQPGLPAVTVRDLVRASLRHRPTRILIGEVRGGEAFDLLQALNTGHSGTLSTIHANSAEQALSRLTACVLLSGIDLPYAAIRYSIGECVQLVIHLERRDRLRVATQVTRVRGYDEVTRRFDLESLACTNGVPSKGGSGGAEPSGSAVSSDAGEEGHGRGADDALGCN
jgi:pilus assembly protein CpaF